MFGSQSTTGVIRFTNPAGEWEYGFNLGASIVIRSDGTWEVRSYSSRSNERTLHSGTLSSINTRPGQTNEVLYSTRGGVWGYYHGLWVNGEWVKFDGPSGENVWAIVVRPDNVKVAVTEVRWGRWCN